MNELVNDREYKNPKSHVPVKVLGATLSRYPDRNTTSKNSLKERQAVRRQKRHRLSLASLKEVVFIV